MYVVRRGKIMIYLEKGGNEIPLATVGEGAMIGEMALFDKKPRSASARAVDNCEVTIISNADFSKILKQIPKWFVSLMATLSSRLRETNIRLENMEAEYKGQVSQLDILKKTLGVLNLLWHTLGIKESKTWVMDREEAEQALAEVTGQPPETINKFTENLIASGMVQQGKNTYKKDILKIPNRGSVERLAKFTSTLHRQDTNLQSLPQSILDIVDILAFLSSNSAYEALTVPLNEVMTEAQARGLDTESWGRSLHLLDGLDDSIEVTQSSEGDAYKVKKKDIPKLLNQCRVLRTLTLHNDRKAKRPKDVA